MEVGGQWSQPVLKADWPEEILPIDLPTAIKAQLQEEGVLNQHEGHTLSYPAWVIGEVVPLDPTGHLLH